MSSKQSVRIYYDRRPEMEWERLEVSWLEYGITKHFIDLAVPEPSRILDIGGGPGRYALALAAQGHDVDLADISPANIALAERRARLQERQLRTASVADATEMSAFADDTYDAVLNLGPLYHLIEEADRVRAVEESMRVLKPGGIAFYAFLSRYAPIYFNAKMNPESIGENRTVVDRVLQSSAYQPRSGEEFFVDAVFVEPGEIEPFMQRFNIRKTCVFGAESVLAQSESILRALAEEARQQWLDLAISVATSTAALYASEHIVFVGQKPE